MYKLLILIKMFINIYSTNKWNGLIEYLLYSQQIYIQRAFLFHSLSQPFFQQFNFLFINYSCALLIISASIQ